MELVPKRPSVLWLWGPNSIMVVFMDPLGMWGTMEGSWGVEEGLISWVYSCGHTTQDVGFTLRLQSSSFWGSILESLTKKKGTPKKELLWSPWVVRGSRGSLRAFGFVVFGVGSLRALPGFQYLGF